MDVPTLPEQINVSETIKALSLDEKVKLLAGRDTWSTYAIQRLGIPTITVSKTALMVLL